MYVTIVLKGQRFFMGHVFSGDYYNKEFMAGAKILLKKHGAGEYCMVAIDIEHFRLFNKLYGREAGDELITNINDCVEGYALKYKGAPGYLGADNFAIVMPYDGGIVEDLRDSIIELVGKWSDTVGFYPFIGVYVIHDVSEDPQLMYDRAAMALSQIKNNNSQFDRIMLYQSEMESQLEGEVFLLSQIQAALKNDEFEFYVQPQCNIMTGRIVGAEALVRWIKPDGTLVSPGLFIPVLEKNGMIDQLDRMIWEKVCIWLSQWIQRGYKTVPISINVSRIDMFSMDVTDIISSIMKKYDIPEKLLKVEITESAYTEKNGTILSTVNLLRSKGFKVMMDDFGSGYSSLNMLKDIPVDVIKLDMRFLDINDEDEEKGLSILESVVNMARLLRLPIVVEGVETKKQEQFIRNLGCRYIQGYYYYRPMPVDEFERLIADQNNIDDKGLIYKQVEQLHLREFLDSNFASESMLNNMLGPVVFYEVADNYIQITRVNEQYYNLIGLSPGESENNSRRFWNHILDNDKVKIFNIFENAYENTVSGAAGNIHIMRYDKEIIPIYIRVFFMGEKDGRRLFYSSMVDMSDYDKNKTKRDEPIDESFGELVENVRDLEYWYGNMPYGLCVCKVYLDADEQILDFRIVYANKRLRGLCDNSMKRLHNIVMNNYDVSNEVILQYLYDAAYDGKYREIESYGHISNRYIRFKIYQFQKRFACVSAADISEHYISRLVSKTLLKKYESAYFVHLTDNYYDEIDLTNGKRNGDRGNYEEAINMKFFTGKIVGDNEENVRKFLSARNVQRQLRDKDAIDMLYKRRNENGKAVWYNSTFCVTERNEDGVPQSAVLLIEKVENYISVED